MLQIQETIDEWLKVQAQWVYMEPIFSSQDIRKQVPEEGRLFQTVDKNWNAIMSHCIKNPKVLGSNIYGELLYLKIKSGQLSGYVKWFCNCRF